MSEPWPCENEPPDRENWLDAELRRVAAPRGLLARLRTIPGGFLSSRFAGRDDEALDAMLRDVPLPAKLVGRLIEIGAADCDGGKRRSRLESRAVAASLVVMTWCSYAAALILFWLADYPFAKAAAANWLQAASPLEGSLEIAEPETMTLVDAAVLDAAVLDAPLIGSDDRLADGLAGSLYGDARVGKGLSDARLLAFHSPSIFSATLDFPAAAVREVAGADVLDEPGFDRSFLSRTGVFPRVDPRRHPVSRAPLTTESASYDLARQCLAEGRLPNSDEIRTEEFLAAVDYGLPRPEQSGLALFVAGCQAPWTISRGAVAGERSWLLQIAVQASDFASDADAAAEPDVTEIVAADVRLSVQFNPQAVESYRLYGHEPTRLEGATREPACDLRCGQAASVVYELQFGSPRGAEAASVTLQWRDPRSGAIRRSSRSIGPPDFVADVIDAPPGLRLAALAVAAAEELRQSPFAETIAPSKMLDLARQGATGADLPSEFQKFVDVFEPLLAVQSGAKALDQKPASRREPNSP